MKSHLRQVSLKKSLDFVLLGVVSILVLFGLIMVYDASVVQAFKDFGDYYYYIRQQLIWTVLGLLTAYVMTRVDYRKLKKLSGLGLIVSLGLLVAVLIPGLGISAGGAHRWLNLGIFTVQPAEIFKLVGIIWLATKFESKPRLSHLVLLVGIAVLLMGFLQRDLGSTIVFVFSALILYIISGGLLWKISLSVPALMLALAVLTFTSDYRRKRILAFLDPFSDTQGFTYHISQVLIALGSGGLFGLGLGQSRQKFEYIPEVTTDSIFAIIGEELGFIGGLILIILFLVLIFRGFKIAEKARDNFGRILAFGLTTLIAVQAIINLSAMVSLMPLTGVPLPFISYGGSALVVNLAAIGILLNISKNS